MKRGGKQLVTVSITKPKSTALANTVALPEKIEKRQRMPNPAEVMSNILAERNRINATYGAASSPEKREAEGKAVISAFRVQRDKLVTEYGPRHPSVKLFDEQIANMEKIIAAQTGIIFNEVAASTESPIYGGRNFEQWMRIAKNDREPKTVSDAIAACGFLAEGENKERFVALIRQLARQHGKAGCNLTTFGGQTGQPDEANVYFAGLIKAINRLEPIEVSRFVQGEIESGNENSIGFCSGIFRNASFNGDGDKRKEFTDQVLKIDPLLKRIRDGHVKLGWNLQPFFNECFRQGKTEIDLGLCKEAIRTLEVKDRPYMYQTFTKKFKAGEFDAMIESDFFAESTDGETREAFIHSLKISKYSFSFGGGFGGGGGGFQTASIENQNQRSLLTELLMESIVRTLNEDKPKLKFRTHQYIYFTDDRVVTTSEGQNGEMYWMSKNQGLLRKKPKGMSKAQGTAAIVRHLITELCQIAFDAESFQDNERDELVAFIRKLTESNKAYKDLAKTTEFGNLKIPEDLSTLLKVVNGNEDKEGFSYFVPKNSGGGLGGGGGGGVF